VKALLKAGVAVGDELPTVARKFRLEHFARADEKTIHTDVEAARREGMAEPVAIATHVGGLIFHQLRLSFGRGWVEGGTCSLTFRRPVAVTDFCEAQGVVTGREDLADGVRVACDVWIVNQTGQKVVVGTASCMLPRDAC
jgi:acyl dehydratase